MSDLLLRTLPRRSAPLRMHLEILGRFWGIWVLLAALLTPLVVYLLVRLNVAERTLVRRYKELNEPMPEGILNLLRETGDIPIFAEFFPLLGIGVFTWTLLVWTEERWGGRDYMWSLPVDRPENDLWRVAAGAIWLFAGIVLVIAIGIVIARLSGQSIFPEGSETFWISLLSTPLLIYLLVSIPAVGSRVPLLWILGAVLGIPIAMLVTSMVGFDLFPEFALRMAFGGNDFEYIAAPFSALLAGFQDGMMGWAVGRDQLSGSKTITWLLSVALWTGVAATGVVLAALRRR